MLYTLYIGLQQRLGIAVRKRGGTRIQVVVAVAFTHDVNEQHRRAQPRANEEWPCREMGLLAEEAGRHGLAPFHKPVARETDHPFSVDYLIDFEHVRQVVFHHDESCFGFGHDVGQVRLDGPLFFIGCYQVDLLFKLAHEILRYLEIAHVCANQYAGTIVFGYLPDVVYPVEFIRVFMFQARRDGNLVDDSLPEHKVIAVSVDDASDEAVFAVMAEIIVYRGRLVWRADEII